ncbi:MULTISPECIES: glycosyltransferase [unclassified Ruegeria]|uniref:glycosyltransferase n=1 Tax=unclassified Ruegeria TaxID=2625375 RepID=UPI001487A3C9|nr:MULTISPECIES: glycosyltransferase [unclassified Ruegeria]
MNRSAPNIGIGICTFKRPQGLQRLLRSLPLGLIGVEPEPIVFVVDNDGSDPSVSAVVARVSAETSLDLRIFVEKSPGISAARNRCIEEAQEAGCTSLAMLDDDEWPSEGWLKALVETQRDTGACVVGGIVHPVFPKQNDKLNKYSHFWAVAPQKRSGRDFVHATSNFIIDLAQIADVKAPYFDDAYGLTGGGDLVFFSRLFGLGKRMHWEEHALAFEEIPEKRANWKWMRKRRFRVGNHMVMEEEIAKGRFKTLLKTAGLTVRLLFYPVLRREPNGAMIGWWLETVKVQGRYFAHLGMRSVEYARDGTNLRRVSGAKPSIGS